KLHAQGVTLIATADCGTSSIAEVAHAAKLGIDMIILDHHTVPPELPAAVALVNPKRAENRYPEAELASGGLAFKVMAALYEALALGSLNGQRQQATAAAMELARELLSKEDADAPLIFIGHADIPSGIVGLVAGRLAEEYHRPAVVYQRGEATSRASCRSIPEF